MMESYSPQVRESKSSNILVAFNSNEFSNMYVFPGIGLAAILCKAAHISQDMVSYFKTAYSITS